MLNFITNIKSGNGKGRKNLKKVIQYCFKHNIEYTIHITSAPNHATRIAKALSENDAHTIVAIGGDGTFHEVLNGIPSFEKVALGFIPSGRGNDYARAAKLSLNPIVALKAILNNEIVHSDYIQVNDKRCLNIGGTGLDVVVLEKAAGKTGKISYIMALISTLKNFKPYNISVTSNQITTNFDNCIMAGVCNGIAIGGNIRISPDSKIDDGLLNVVVMSMPKDGKLLKILPKFSKGKLLNAPFTTHFTCESVNVDSEKNYPIQLDGEIFYDTKLHCKIVKGGLRTFKPL